MFTRRGLCLAATLVVLVVPTAHAQPFTARYDAASGLVPESTCPPWERHQLGSGSATVSGNVLTISNGAQSAELHYRVPVAFSTPIRLEFRARRISGTSSSDAREPLGVVVNVGSNVGIHFFVGNDRIYLTNGTNSRGPTNTTIDTDVMHTYRLEVGGTSASVYVDDVLTLTGSTFFSSADFFPDPAINWGDFTSVADGTSEWQFVEHNSSAIACTAVPVAGPLALAALAGVLLLVAGGSIRRKLVS